MRQPLLSNSRKVVFCPAAHKTRESRQEAVGPETKGASLILQNKAGENLPSFLPFPTFSLTTFTLPYLNIVCVQQK